MTAGLRSTPATARRDAASSARRRPSTGRGRASANGTRHVDGDWGAGIARRRSCGPSSARSATRARVLFGRATTLSAAPARSFTTGSEARTRAPSRPTPAAPRAMMGELIGGQTSARRDRGCPLEERRPSKFDGLARCSSRARERDRSIGRCRLGGINYCDARGAPARDHHVSVSSPCPRRGASSSGPTGRAGGGCDGRDPFFVGEIQPRPVDRGTCRSVTNPPPPPTVLDRITDFRLRTRDLLEQLAEPSSTATRARTPAAGWDDNVETAERAPSSPPAGVVGVPPRARPTGGWRPASIRRRTARAVAYAGRSGGSGAGCTRRAGGDGVLVMHPNRRRGPQR